MCFKEEKARVFSHYKKGNEDFYLSQRARIIQENKTSQNLTLTHPTIVNNLRVFRHYKSEVEGFSIVTTREGIVIGR